jgi:hypothetical protein
MAGVLNARDRRLYQATAVQCPPLLGVRLSAKSPGLGGCTEYNRIIFEGIKARPEVRTVILAARWPLYTETAGFGADSKEFVLLVDDKTGIPGVADTRRVIREALERTIGALEAAGKSVVVLGPVPEIGFDVPACVARRNMPLSVARSCEVSPAVVAERIGFAESWIRSVHAPERRVCAALPSEFMCSEAGCRSTLAGTPLYVDDDHLTRSGAEWLIGRMNFQPCL